MTTKTARQEAAADERAALLDRLGDEVEIVKSSDGWQRWLDFSSKLHTYSFRNTILIHMQRPDATVVMPYGAKDKSTGWLSVGRQVRKGEKGIKIFAPIIRKLTPEEAAERATETTGTGRKLVGFKLVSVFDVAQTDGDELPKSPGAMWRDELAKDDGKVDAAALTIVRAACKVLGRSIVMEDGDPSGRGALGWMSPRNREALHIVATDNAHVLSTLVHELAHSLDPKLGEVSYDTSELVAESVAWLVCSRLGVEPRGLAAATYLAGYNATPDAMEAVADRVLKIVKQIEEAINDAAGAR